MTMHVRVAGTWREVTDPSVRVSGTWRAVSEGWVRVSGVWRRFYNRLPALSATAAPTNVSGGCTAPPNGECAAFSGAVTAMPSGGVPPYNYSWEYFSGDLIPPVNPFAQTTQFFNDALVPASSSAVYRCRVTDAASQQVFTNEVAVSLTHSST